MPVRPPELITQSLSGNNCILEHWALANGMGWPTLLCREGSKPPVNDLQRYSASTILFYPTMIIQFIPIMVYSHVSIQGPTAIPNKWYDRLWLLPVDDPDVGGTA